MESAFELLDQVAGACEELGIPYVVAGSIAAMAYGGLRLTQDVDFVLVLRPEALSPLLARFPRPNFYYDEAAALGPGPHYLERDRGRSK